MKYFFDTEFIEGFHKPFLGKERHFIDLISIGICCEDGAKYYALSSEYDYNKADPWVVENVILPLYLEFVNGDARNHFTVKNFHKYYGKKNKTIADEIKAFVNYEAHFVVSENTAKQNPGSFVNPTFYAYYADYDWVLFCSLFGKMIDLPKGYPMYCRDLKQILDDRVSSMQNSDFFFNTNVSSPQLSMDEKVALFKKIKGFPKQKCEHNALEDAKWNLNLFIFLGGRIVPTVTSSHPYYEK